MRISKFLEYIKESNVDVNILEEYLVGIKDLDIEYDISPIRTLTQGEFAGRKSITIQFNLSKLNITNISPVIDREMISDTKIWEFLDELITLKNRLDSDKVALHLGSIGARWRVGISFLVGTKIESGEEYDLSKIFNEIRNKSLQAKSDFANSMTYKMENSKIIINISDSYTDRKLNLFLRGIDLNNYNIKVEKIEIRFTTGAKVTISRK